MKIKTANLIGPALDWAVAKCEGVAVTYLDDGITRCLLRTPSGRFNPSTSWQEGGPIIEREEIYLAKSILGGWTASIYTKEKGTNCILHGGPTPLITAMRCFVASRLGDEVEVPEELK